MATDIFSFWERIGPSDNIHPADKDVLKRVDHGFDLGCLPGAYFGRLRAAKVVLLFLSPGLGPRNVEEASKSDAQQRYVRQRSGNEPLPSKDDDPDFFEWWSQRVNVFGNPMYLRDKIAFLNIGAYKSEIFNDHPLLASLPSCRVSLDWAQANLFPEALDGRRIVICLRSHRYWGLKQNKVYGKSLYSPKTVRGGHMIRVPLRCEIIKMVKERLGS